MGQALPKPALRPFLVEDVPVVIEIFTSAIEELAAEDYGEAQLAAWVAQADEEAFAARLAGQLTLVATLNHSPGRVRIVARATMSSTCSMSTPRPPARASPRCWWTPWKNSPPPAERPRLSVDASDTAAPLFLKRGYTADRRITREVAGEWLGNTSMHKALTPAARSTGR